MSWKLRLIKWLASDRPVAMNLRLTRGLYIDGTKSTAGYYWNVRVDHKNDDKEFPDECGIHIYSGNKKLAND